MFSLNDRVALVAGASRGLGKAMAVGLAEVGADLALVARTEEHLNETRVKIEGIGRRVACWGYDLHRTEGIPDLVRQVETTLGRIDILVNGAGVTHRVAAVEFPEEKWDEIIQVNLKAVWLLCQHVGRGMLERRYGKIINIASLMSFSGGIYIPAYTASKGAVAQLTKALANEWAGRGVNVNAICPGYMRTDMTEAILDDPVRSRQLLERIPAGRFGEPDDLVGAVVFLASDASRYVHGHIFVVDGGWMAR
ncbi:MAG: glucose 1-dehydrogenase [Candidatus Latescibacteria bacterium]|nr:glucose 1-dehydrogenase [Candidatus Latescibacterota bacterium]